MDAKYSYVYILANKKNGVLYVGITSDLVRRVSEHKNNAVKGFTEKYHVHTLVYYEESESITSAIEREKHIKKWLRKWKVELIEKDNPDWNDLYYNLLES